MANTNASARHPPKCRDRTTTMNRTLGDRTLVRRRLRRKLRAMTPIPNLLYELMGFGHFTRMAMTRDGLLIGQPHRSVGFDAFIGRVPESACKLNARLWRELDAAERALVIERLAEQEIAPQNIGLDSTLGTCCDCRACRDHCDD